jgi:predicted deacylase
LVWASCAFLAACDPSPASQNLKAKRVGDPPAATATAAIAPPAESSPVPHQVASPIGEPTSLSKSLPRPVGAEPATDPSTAAMPLNPGPFARAETEFGPNTPAAATTAATLTLLGEEIPPGESKRLVWSASQIFEGVSTETPVLVVNGREGGVTLCLTAAIHGDELNGIEMVRRVLHDLDPQKLKGAVIGVPIVNLQGFRRGSRYLPDRRDLNRYFPGNPDGSSAARIANSFFSEIISHCDALVDLHTGSFYRTNLPQLRADLRYSKIKELTQGFGGMVVLHSEAAPGTLRRAATDAGIPTITLEAGEPLRLQSAKVSQGVTGIFTLLDTLEIVDRAQFLAPPEPVFYESTWVRSNDGGILFTVVRLGQVVETGDVLGTVTDPITNEQNLIYSPTGGRILGMALNQVVMPGFATFRIGIETEGPPIYAFDPSPDWDLGEDRTGTGSAVVATKKPGDLLLRDITADSEESSE